MGVQMQVAIGQWQVYTITQSPFQLGLVGLFNVLPVILLGVFGGTVSDMVDRRKLVAGAQIARVAIGLALAALTLSGSVEVWQIYVGGLLASFSNAFDGPARQAIVFSLVPRHHLMNAVTWHNVQRDASNLVGPAVAGALMAAASIGAAYFAEALFFIPLLVVMLLVAVGGTLPERRPAIEVLREGLSFLRQTPTILTSLSLDFSLTFFGAYRALLAVYARDILGVGPAGFGLLTSAAALGGMGGSAFVLSLGESRRKGPIQLSATLVYAGAVAAFGLSTWFGLSLAICAVLGFCDTVAGIMRRSIIQLATPEGLQGRVAAVQQIVATGGPALGGVQAGTMSGLLGAPQTLVIGGAVCGGYAAFTAIRARAFRSV